MRQHNSILIFLIFTAIVQVLFGVSWAREPTINRDHVVTTSQHLMSKKSIAKEEPIHRNHQVSGCNSVAAGYLLADPTDNRLNMSSLIDYKLSKILRLDSPDMRPSRDYNDFKDISVDISMRAWTLLHEHASVALHDRIEVIWPAVDEILKSAEVSNKCHDAIQSVMEGGKRMESWAIKLMNSWGTFPMSGIFEGTYGDVGSFHTCVDIKNSKHIDHAHYCSLTFRPVMPSRRDYELVVRKEPEELLKIFEKSMAPRNGDFSVVNLNNNRTNSTYDEYVPRDAFTDILKHAQYHHYVYYKLGTCWPIQCSPFDIKRVAKLIGRRNILMTGPIKCYSKFSDDYEEPGVVVDGDATSGSLNSTQKLVVSVWDKNNGIFIWKPHFNKAHMIALAIIVAVSMFILIMTLIDLFVNRIPSLLFKFKLAMRGLPLNSENKSSVCQPLTQDQIGHHNSGPHNSFALSGEITHKHSASHVGFTMVPTETTIDLENDIYPQQIPTFMRIVDDCSILTNAQQFFHVSEGQMKNDILCLNGLRCITMIWIIMTHTMMYNDWSGFARTREVEKSLNSLLSQPLFNGSYLVDTFFLMSGLLSAFTAFKHSQGIRAKFNSFAYIFGRWLRLTPQILFISMIYIVLPAISYGPHWFPIVGEYSENCVQNWWINALHLQAFYKKDEMCNFVTWWVSIDFFYHFLSLVYIWIIMCIGPHSGFLSMTIFIVYRIIRQCMKHYNLGMPPNVFSTIPQTGAMWTKMTLAFFWTPDTHMVPYFFGFYFGYLMALKRTIILKYLNTRLSLIGWSISITLLTAQSYSTFWWVTGKADYSRLVSTIFYTLCPIIWTSSLCWIIIACHYGYGGFINRVLSCKTFIVLGKASYLVYLSHFQILFLFFGNQNLLLEPTTLNMFYIILGNIFISTLLGIFLCIIYELPWLNIHRRLMKYF